MIQRGQKTSQAYKEHQKTTLGIRAAEWQKRSTHKKNKKKRIQAVP